MRALIATLALLLTVGCGQVGHGSKQLEKIDRLEIWRAVLVSQAFAKQVSEVVKHETGRDEYDQIYEEHLAPVLKRYGLDRISAFLVFEEEGGWPNDSVGDCPSK